MKPSFPQQPFTQAHHITIAQIFDWNSTNAKTIQIMSYFELLEDSLLGEGSFGKVYQCHWHGSFAAAKLFNAFEVDELPKVFQEIELIKKLHNDYIVQFLGTVHYKSKLCLITNYAENGSLYRALARHTLSNEQKPSIITGLIHGMQYLKSNHIVHRDLRSPNVLLDSNHVPKICDFGLATLKRKSTTIKTLSLVESTRWMAPEMLQDSPCYSFESDVYALGMVIWEILTEKLPYADNPDMATITVLIKCGEHEEIPDSFPEHYKSIIKSCWHLAPKERASVEEISKLNEQAMQQMDTPLNNRPVNKVLSPSLQPTVSDSGSTPSHQHPTHLSHLSGMDAVTKSKSTCYVKVVDQYMRDSSSILDAKEHLVSMLETHGDGLTQWILATASQGNEVSAAALGEMYFYGCGVPQDYQAAFEQISMATEKERGGQRNSEYKATSTEAINQCKTRVQFNLGWMYENGQGVPQSDGKAVVWYTKAAEQGNAIAQTSLGEMHLLGQGVPQSDDEAVKWFKKAADQSNSDAQFYLGLLHRKGLGVPVSDYKAMEWMHKAAEQGNVTAGEFMGWPYDKAYFAENGDREVEQCKKAAEQGCPRAQTLLGCIYECTLLNPRKDDKAAAWYKKAAKQGYSEAQFRLGKMYECGQGLPQSNYLAVEWLLKAAEQGHVCAQYELGCMYQSGRGVPQSDGNAVEWLSKSAKQGGVKAQLKLGDLYVNGLDGKQNVEKAVEWYTKAAERGYWTGGHCFEEFEYQSIQEIQHSVNNVVENYTKAAEQGDSNAQFKLGWVFDRILCVQNYDKAIEWYMKAAEQGNVAAQARLGDMCDKGEGVTQRHDKAFEWFKKAAENGYAYAQTLLASMHMAGQCVPRNYDKANVLVMKGLVHGFNPYLDYDRWMKKNCISKGSGVRKTVR